MELYRRGVQRSADVRSAVVRPCKFPAYDDCQAGGYRYPVVWQIEIFHIHEHAIYDERKQAQLDHFGIRLYPCQVRNMADAPFELNTTDHAEQNHKHESN